GVSSHSFLTISVSRLVCPRTLHSFPTRRSSDLYAGLLWDGCQNTPGRISGSPLTSLWRKSSRWGYRRRWKRITVSSWLKCDRGRSEEHTSELQSLAYLVCRLLLEKKKINHSIYK